MYVIALRCVPGVALVVKDRCRATVVFTVPSETSKYGCACQRKYEEEDMYACPYTDMLATVERYSRADLPVVCLPEEEMPPGTAVQWVCLPVGTLCLPLQWTIYAWFAV